MDRLISFPLYHFQQGGATEIFSMEKIMAKKEVAKTFRVDEDFERWMSRAVTDLDCSLSELIRTALLLAIPLIRECPSILRRITLEDLKGQSD